MITATATDTDTSSTNNNIPSTSTSIPPTPEPLKSLRLNLISTAVQFLIDEKVKSAPLAVKVEFLKGKGLTSEEIELSLVRAIDMSYIEQLN